MFASQYLNISIVKLLIKKSANVNLKDIYGRTALMNVCINLHAVNSIEILKLLLENGANVNLRDNCGNTALIIVASRYLSNEANSIEILKLLLENI